MEVVVQRFRTRLGVRGAVGGGVLLGAVLACNSQRGDEIITGNAGNICIVCCHREALHDLSSERGRKETEPVPVTAFSLLPRGRLLFLPPALVALPRGTCCNTV